MKKILWGKTPKLINNMAVLALCLLLTGCTTLSYVDSDFANIKKSNIQTNEMFSLSVYEKQSEQAVINAGVSETVLEGALVLYLNIKNNSDSMYKFDMEDIAVTSPIGEVSVIPPAQYIEAYQNFEASNYTGFANASTQLSQFANIQNNYRRTSLTNESRLESANMAPEFAQLENTIRGIQSHTITSYKFINPKSEEYFYVFLRKPDEYPITVKYKDLTYKFGSKKNVQE